jgi:hypothetical protein
VARRVRDANLETREARGRLKPGGKPYWRSLERGLHLDYRRLRGKPRTWNVRHYLGDHRYEIKQIGIAECRWRCDPGHLAGANGSTRADGEACTCRRRQR